MGRKETILELAPHYVVMLVLVTVVLAIVRTTVDLGFWAEFVLIVGIVFVYPLIVRQLGYEPSAWKKE